MKGKKFFCFILLIFSFTTIFYAKEKDSMSLFEIDRLIRKTDYDEALRQLNIYLEKNPEQFDNVQSRISRIMNAKIRYSELAEELLDIIRNDPTNNKKIYEITAELERFERNPSDKNLKFIADLKKSAEFNYFRAQFLEIQQSMASLTEKENYLGAVKKAQEGFWLYKENFYVKWEDKPEIISGVEGVVNTLNEHLALYEAKNFVSDIQKAVNDFIREVKLDSYEGALKKFNAVKQKLSQYSSLRSDIIKDKMKMDQAVLALQKLDPDMSDASYLPFLIHFLTGVDVVEKSGIITALNAQWDGFIKDMNDSVFNMVTKKYQLYENGINEEFRDNLLKYIALNNSVIALYDLPNKDENTALLNPLQDYSMLLTYVENLSLNSLEANNLLVAVESNKESQNSVIESLKNDTEKKNKDSYLDELVRYSLKLEEIASTKSEFNNSYEEWSKSYKDSEYENFDALTSLFEEKVNTIYKTKNEILNRSWSVISSYYTTLSDILYNDLKEYTMALSSFNKGLSVKLTTEEYKDINKNISKASLYQKEHDDENKDMGIYYRYPDITLKMVTYVEGEINKRVKTITNYKKDLNKLFSKNESWALSKDLSSTINGANKKLDETVSLLYSLNNEIETQSAIAMEYSGKSQIAENEADLRFREAEKALRNENFTLARRKLQNAVTKYDEALNYQNDEENRTLWDNKLSKLGDDIAHRENELIVREVRDLKTKAKDAYFNGRFDDAEKYLNQASSKWAITNVTEDPEITNLRNFVNTAISMKTGRDILPSAPQYPEMSQLLNIARTSYDEGSKLLNEGDSINAELQFEIAEASIQKVQYVYPLNQEAALITLQINRIKDPDKFENEFATKIEQARGLCKNSETQQEGYANLLDYYKLDPNYPGLKQLIYDVEIDIGIRQKPVDNSGKKKAQEYIAQANKLYKRAGDDRVLLSNALDKVNEALVLLPYDNTAMDLKDKIITKMGATNKASLSIEDERLYQNALKCLMENKIATARNIVDELLQKPENRYSKKIEDLKKQIDARS